MTGKLSALEVIISDNRIGFILDIVKNLTPASSSLHETEIQRRQQLTTEMKQEMKTQLDKKDALPQKESTTPYIDISIELEAIRLSFEKETETSN